MGLFNSGKNDKVEKVSKYERHYNVPEHSSRRHSSKRRPHQGEGGGGRAMSQPPLMRLPAGGGGFYQAGAVFNPGLVPPNYMGAVRYPLSPYDLSKFSSGGAFSANPFAAGQMSPMNFAPVWNNGMALINQRSPFQGGFNDYQGNGWPVLPPSNYGYGGPMHF